MIFVNKIFFLMLRVGDSNKKVCSLKKKTLKIAHYFYVGKATDLKTVFKKALE